MTIPLLSKAFVREWTELAEKYEMPKARFAIKAMREYHAKRTRAKSGKQLQQGLTKQERSERGRKAVLARWAKRGG